MRIFAACPCRAIAFALCVLLTSNTGSHAQLPDGSIAPDFTATDINGVEHNLYDLLDQGKKVIVQFSATWCPPCWSYHTSGALESVWNIYGPDGTDEVFVFFIEGDDTTTLEDLQGTGTATMGDWVSNTPYPIIDNGGNIFDAYQGAYYPTIYTICPNRILTESGQITSAAHAELLFAPGCAAATLSSDVALVEYTGETSGCLGEPATLSVLIMNTGTSALTYATIGVFVDGIQVSTTTWTGNLSTYETADVTLSGYLFSSDSEFEVRLTSGDQNDANDAVTTFFNVGDFATEYIFIEIGTDGWGAETGWVIESSAGEVIAEVPQGTLGNTNEYQWEIMVPADECFEFRIVDSYGDGLHGSQWGSIDGYCRVTSYEGFPTGGLTPVSTILDYDGSYDFSELSVYFQPSGDMVDSELFGCTNPDAINYAPGAQFDDGSCILNAGCLDIGMDFWATEVLFGCHPSASTGYIGDELWYTGAGELATGWVLNVPEMVEDPASGVVYPVHSFEVQSVSGFPAGCTGSLELLSLNGGDQTCLTMDGFPIQLGVYDVVVTGEMSISVFGTPFSIGTWETTLELTVESNPNPISGCTYSGAANYNFIANLDDASCIFSGCTDPAALNYHPLFTEDDGGCLYSCNTGASECPTDVNGDALTTVADLVVLLSQFGYPCE